MRSAIIAAALLLSASGFSQKKAPVATAQKARIEISGLILDASTHKPASGVRVVLPKVSADITDVDGKFKVKVPHTLVTLVISGEGYASREVALKGRKSITVELLDASHEAILEDVNTGNGLRAGTKTSAAIKQVNVNGWDYSAESPDALLQGRVAGLQVIRRSGMPGAGASMFMRGYNSLYTTSKPLIVVDNMIYDDNEYGNSIVANTIVNPLSLIDVKDIDNISVIKDASSIYGSKGANGAIVITTAHTTDQATKISFGAYSGYNQAPENLPLLNAADYRSYLGDVLKAKGLTNTQIAALPYMNDDPANPQYFAYHNSTNWQKKIMADSYTNNYYLKVTGGDNIATYGLSMGFMKNQGVIKETDMSRYNTRFNADFNFTKRFTGYTNLSFSYNEQNLKDQGISDKTSPLFLSLVKAPFLNDKEVNALGIESPNLADVDALNIGNPVAVIKNMQAYNRYYRFFGTFGFKFDINSKLSARSDFGITFDKIRENIFVPSKGVVKDTLSNAIANNRLGSQVKRLFTFYNDSRIEYISALGADGKLNARLGLRYQMNNAEQDFAIGYNSATDELVSVQNGLAALRQIGGGIGQWNWMNTYASANYNFRETWLLDLNVAMDGSSRFGTEAKSGVQIAGRKFPIFPSVGLAWLISSEKFMANSKIDLLKLRAGWHFTGNDDIGNSTARQTYVGQNLLGMQGLVRSGLSNPGIQWEQVRKLNLGVDVAILNERLSASLDLYHHRTSNMLIYHTTPFASAFTNILLNDGGMENRGIELAVNGRLIQHKNFTWDLGFNIARNENKIVSLPGGTTYTNLAGATIITRENESASQFYGYKALGVFALTSEAQANGGLQKRNADGSFSSFQAGDVKFADLNNDKIIDEKDRTVIGNATPDFYGGINSRMKWNRFEFSALITFSKGNDVYNYTRYRLESASGVENQTQRVLDRWRTEGQFTDVPKATWGDPLGNNRFSDRWIEDGSYMRLRNISLSYYIPVKSSIVNDVNVYINGSNLFTLTNYKGYDPEFSGGSSLFTQGIDTGLYPQFKNVTLGLRIGL